MRKIKQLLPLILIAFFIQFAFAQDYKPAHPYFTVPYSVNPSFTVSIPYDFTIYDIISDNLQRLERCKDDIACIVRESSVIEKETGFNWILSYGGNIKTGDEKTVLEYPEWTAYCEPSDQHAINSLAEAIDTCVSSKESGCYCPYIIPGIPKKNMAEWREERAGFALLAPVLNIMPDALSHLSEAGLWDERRISIKQQGSSLKISMSYPGNPVPQTVPGAYLKEIQSGLRGSTPDEFRYPAAMVGKTIYIYKDSARNISLHQSMPPAGECTVYDKTVKFCIIQNQRFLAYNQRDNKVGLHQPVLKFAYSFTSEVTDVRNFNIYDAKMASNTSLLVWDNIPNADYFTIYYSDKGKMMEGTLRGLNPSETEIDEIDGLESLRLDVRDNPVQVKIDSLMDPVCIVGEEEPYTCRLKYGIETVIAGQAPDVQLEKGKLYYSVPDDKYFYFMQGIKNDITYFFAITATDSNGVESPSFNLPVHYEQSKDDLPPGLAEIISIQFDAGYAYVRTRPITYNVDTTPLDPGDVTHYKLYCFEKGLMKSFELAPDRSFFPEKRSELEGQIQELRTPLAEFRAYCGLLPGAMPEAYVFVAGFKGTDLGHKGQTTIEPAAITTVLTEELAG